MDNSWFQALFAAGNAFDEKIREIFTAVVADRPNKVEVTAAIKAAVDQLRAELAAATKSLRDDLATKKALADAVKSLRDDLATKVAFDALAARLAELEDTRPRFVRVEGMIATAIEPLARRTELTPLATDADLAAAVRTLVARTELPALATDAELAAAVATLPTKAQVDAKADATVVAALPTDARVAEMIAAAIAALPSTTPSPAET